MDDPVSVKSFIEKVRQARKQWDVLIDDMGVADLKKPGFCGAWTGRDVIAHITWHEKEMLGVIRTHALSGSDLWNLPTDQRNQAIYTANKDRKLQDVLTEAKIVYAELLQALQTLNDEDLNDASRFAEMPADWQPWSLLAGNTYEHYLDHLANK
jgi:hypothetical protein